ncbi:hypothetical protein MtrunA17_Chr7g0246851 [Medicago truncatula]|uniref:Uncharacterized protein n=1 Tax=Medicago truncatula TaxID=3880 RepID=A0A396H309_MEDTR|nr:hypothetical protein MtrunA17_Chr7g0246851 [Medicago truncatula]
MWKGGVDAACCGWGRGAEVGLSHLWFFFFLTLKHCYYVRLFEKCCLCCLMKCTKVTVGDILSVPFSVFLHTFNDFFLHQSHFFFHTFNDLNMGVWISSLCGATRDHLEFIL